MPCRANTSALVVLRDKVTHELYDIDDIVAYTNVEFMILAGKIVIFCQNSASIGKLIFGMSFKRHF